MVTWCGCSSTDPWSKATPFGARRSEVRAAAAEGLGVLSPGAPGAVPALSYALGDDDADVRVAAAESLGACGQRATDAVPALEAARKGCHRSLRQAAAAALAKIREGEAVSPGQRAR